MQKYPHSAVIARLRTYGVGHLISRFTHVLMLPNPDNPPARVAQPRIGVAISLTVASDLVYPERGVALETE